MQMGAMTEHNLYQGFAKPMSTSDFERLSEFIQSQCGIKMPAGKKVMLEARLQKRLRTLGFSTFREYCDHLFDERGNDEVVHFINAVTTNKTDFFREPVHFSVLTETVLPEYLEAEGANGIFRVWSAGCSTGEEPYTIAMVLSEYASLHPGFRFSILATDISTRVLDKAKQAIYEYDRVVTVPLALKQKYLMRSKERGKGLVRIVPAIRALVQFEQVNLMDEELRLSDPLDAIFCRNVIIYFERRNQERLLRRLCHCLKPGGYLFLGHSETVHGFDLPLLRATSTVYRKVV
jgi:chemotaxis protein methyltransferase CheR